MTTLRIKYTKEKYMRFLGHLELMKLFERIFRFEKLPLKYSEGFNPIPKMTFAAPLSVGYSSQGEVMEVQLLEKISLDFVKNIKFPPGIKIVDAKYVNCKKSLMAGMEYAEYLVKVDFEDSVESLAIHHWIGDFLASESVVYEKKTKKGTTKSVNVLEYIRDFKCIYQEGSDLVFRTVLNSGSQGSLNPEKLFELFFEHYNYRVKVKDISVERLQLLFSNGNELINIFDLSDEVVQ